MILSSHGHSVAQIRTPKTLQNRGICRKLMLLGLWVQSRTQKMAIPTSLRSCIMAEHVTLSPGDPRD